MLFDEAFNDLMDLECGPNIRRPPWGIEQKYIDPWFIKKGLPKTDVSQLTEDIARAFIYEDYWLEMGCENLVDKLDFTLLQAGVNCGQGTAVRWLQEIIGVNVDGITGPKTLEVANTKNTVTVIRKFLKKQNDFYVSLHNTTFGGGWHNRVLNTAKMLGVSLEEAKPLPIISIGDIPMNAVQMFWSKVGVGIAAFGTYAYLLHIEMSSGKPLPADARTLMTASFGVVTGIIAHLMTNKNSAPPPPSA